MSTIKADENGDWVIESGSLVLLGRNEEERSFEISQRQRQALSTFFGEWYLNRLIGIPYFQIIFQKGADLAEIRDIFRKKIMEVDGRFELEDFNLKIDRRERSLLLNYSLRIMPINENLNLSFQFSGEGNTDFRVMPAG